MYAEGKHTVADIISALFDKNAQGEGKTRWGDKTTLLQKPVQKDNQGQWRRKMTRRKVEIFEEVVAIP